MQVSPAVTVRPADLTVSAIRRASAPGARAWVRATGFHLETPQRRRMRALMDAAAATDSTVSLAFIKEDGTLRNMRALPMVAGDPTRKYYTVVDLDKSDEAGSRVYRRISLDSVATLTVEHHALPML